MSKARAFWRALVLVLTAVVVSLGAAEVAARLATGVDARVARAEREDFVARIPGLGAKSDATGARRIVQMAYGSRFELHPFFGFTAARGEGEVNRHGFSTGGIEYPYERSPDEFVVGIFGGSVAMQVVGNAGALQAAIEPLAAEKGYERVTTLSFSGGAWRQPQTLFALLHYLPTIDAAIVLDGFNEIIQLSPIRLERWPAEFPAADIYGSLARQSPYDEATTARLVVLNESAGVVSEWFDGPVIRSSVLAHLAWRVLASRYGQVADRLRAEAAASPDARPSDPAAVGSVDDQIVRYYQLYEDSIRNMAAVGRDRGMPVLHFVQPNQYDRGAKPLSEQEREEFTRAGYFEHVTAAYDRLEAMSSRLAASGVESHYLGDLFRDEPRTMYADACCHLNDDGLERLGSAMGEAFAHSPQLDRLPTSAERGRGGLPAPP